jgi:uncharacterized protein
VQGFRLSSRRYSEDRNVAVRPSQEIETAEAGTSGPVVTAERVELLDVLRGAALLGIFLVNFNTDYLATPRSIVDRVARLAIGFFCFGSFYPLFSFLFGLGFALQVERASTRALLVRRYVRRLVALFVIGIAHSVFLWRGDILSRYALLGFGLLAVRRLSSRVVLGIAAASFAAAVVVGEVQSTRSGAGVVEQNRTAAVATSAGPMAAVRQQERWVVLHGSYAQLVRVNAEGLWLRSSHVYEQAWLFHVLAIFLVGFVAGRAGILVRPAEHRSLLRGILWIGLAVGVLGNFLDEVAPSLATRGLLPWAFTDLHVVSWIGDPGLSCFYGAGLTLLFVGSPRWRRRLAPLGRVGRMALTNYLGQSLVMLLLMTGFGLGLAFRVGYALSIPLKCAIFATQVALSVWWLHRFDFGPAEWVWRWATYGSRPRIRRLEYKRAG